MAQDQSNIKTGQVCKTRQTESEMSQYNLFIADTKVNDSKKSDYLARYKYFFQKFLMVPLLLNLEIKWVSQPMHTDTGGVGNIPNRSTLPVRFILLNLVLVVVLVSEFKALYCCTCYQPRSDTEHEIRKPGKKRSHVRVRYTQMFLACVLVSVCETHASAIKQNLRPMTVHTLYSLYFAFRHNFLYFTTSGQK